MLRFTAKNYLWTTLLLAMLFFVPAEANAELKNKSSWLGQSNKNQPIKDREIEKRVRWSDRFKFSMPWRIMRRMSLGNKPAINPKTVRASTRVKDPQTVNPSPSRASQLQYMTVIKAQIIKHTIEATRLGKQAKIALKAKDFESYRMLLIAIKHEETQAVGLKSDLYTMMAVIKREDDLRKDRMAQSQKNFKKHIAQATESRHSPAASRDRRHQVQVLKTKVRVLESRLEILEAQANIARIEGDKAGSQEKHNEAGVLNLQINRLKNEINQVINSSARLARSGRSTAAQAGYQGRLDRFRSKYIAPYLLRGRIPDAEVLLKKYEKFVGDKSI